MQRFIAQQNLMRFQCLVATELDDRIRRFLKQKIVETQRELALLNAAADGLATSFSIGPDPHQLAGRSQPTRHFQAEFEQAARPYLLLDPRPGLRIVDVNDAYARATMVSRPDVAGQKLFDVFPDNPDDPAADGVAKLYLSLKLAAETGRRHAMKIQHYDIRDPAGHFITRYWLPVNTPIFDQDHRLLFLLHHVEDVTEMILHQMSGVTLAPQADAEDCAIGQ